MTRMARLPEDILTTILKSEKGTRHESMGKYVFKVAVTATKIDIQRAVEEHYNVDVVRVNTMMMRGKWRRVRQRAGRTPDWKKAIVTLKEGQSLEATG